MIEEHLQSIQKQYRNLKDAEKQDFEAILSSLLEITEKTHQSQNNHLKDVKKYLSGKLRRDVEETDIDSIFVLKNLVSRKNKYNDKIHALVLSFIWDLLAVIYELKENQALFNFIGYFLRVELPDTLVAKSKQDIIQAYKQAYSELPRELQIKRMQHLATNTLVASKPSELKRFNDRIKS